MLGADITVKVIRKLDCTFGKMDKIYMLIKVSMDLKLSREITKWSVRPFHVW